MDKSAKHAVKSNCIGLGAHTAEARWFGVSQPGIKSNQTLPLAKKRNSKDKKQKPTRKY